MSFTEDVAANLFSGVIAGGLSSAGTLAWLRAQEWRRARRLWRLCDPRNLTVIVSTSQTPRHIDGSSRPGTGVGQLRSVAILTPSLIKGYGDSLRPDMVMLSTQAAELAEHVEGDVILLGGPRTNEITRRVCELEGLPVYMRDAARDGGTGQVDSRIHWSPTGGEPVVLDTADEGEWAYGFVLRQQNVLAPGQRGRLWVIAGSSTFGTQAAAEWLVANAKTLRKAPETASFVVRAALLGSPARGIRKPELYLPSAAGA